MGCGACCCEERLLIGGFAVGLDGGGVVVLGIRFLLIGRDLGMVMH